MPTQQYKLQSLIELLRAPPDVSGLPQTVRDAWAACVGAWDALAASERLSIRAAAGPTVAEAVRKWQGTVAAQAARADAPESVKALAASLAAKESAAAETGGASNG